MTIKEQLKKWYLEDHISIKKIAKKLNLSYGTVKRYFEINNIEIYRRTKTKEEIIVERISKEEIIDLLKKYNWSAIKAAQSINIDYKHFRIWTDSYKIPRKFKRKPNGQKMTDEEYIQRFEEWSEFSIENLSELTPTTE